MKLCMHKTMDIFLLCICVQLLPVILASENSSTYINKSTSKCSTIKHFGFTTEVGASALQFYHTILLLCSSRTMNTCTLRRSGKYVELPCIIYRAYWCIQTHCLCIRCCNSRCNFLECCGKLHYHDSCQHL